MKIVTTVIAWFQFIKAAAISRAIAAHNQNRDRASEVINEIIMHTGQHCDRNMADSIGSMIYNPG